MTVDFKPAWIRRVAPSLIVCEHCGKRSPATLTSEDRAFIAVHARCAAPVAKAAT